QLIVHCQHRLLEWRHCAPRDRVTAYPRSIRKATIWSVVNSASGDAAATPAGAFARGAKAWTASGGFTLDATGGAAGGGALVVRGVRALFAARVAAAFCPRVNSGSGASGVGTGSAG